MIGGYDLLYLWPEGKNYAQVEKGILDICRREWPGLVVEYDDPPNGAPSRRLRQELSRNEFFIFQTAQDKELWDTHGYTRRYTHNTCIYVIIERDAAGKPWAVADREITVVVDHPNGYRVRKIIKALNAFLVPLP